MDMIRVARELGLASSVILFRHFGKKPLLLIVFGLIIWALECLMEIHKRRSALSETNQTMTNTKKIRHLLIDKDLKVAEFAEQLGMKQYNCSKMIRGRKPFFAYRERAAQLLGVPVDSIFPDSPRQAS